MGAFQVNKDLIPIKAHYFLLNGAHAGVLPFITVYAKQLGISADVIGLVMAILCCVTVISRPLLGSIADHLQKLKLVMIALIFIDISADMGLNFIPPSTTDLTQSSVVCHRNVSYIFQFDPYACKKNSSFCDKCILSCDICQDDSGICLKNSLGHPETLKDDSIKNSSKNPILQLCFLSIFTAIIYICNGSIVSLSDAACFNALGTRPELYGKQRLWGTIGWGSFALLAGYLNQILTGTSGKYNFSAGFYMLVLLLLTDLLVISKLKLKDVKASKNIFKDVGLLLVKPRIAIFILQVYFVEPMVGLAYRIFTRTLFRHLLYSNDILCKKIAPEGTEATVQGLASGTFEGLGVATGSLLGGYGFRTFGGRTTLFWTGIISFAFGVINSLINYVMIRNQSETREK
ncbi:Major facilitator superfamily like protein [Argiope bruennichi]|uniref:Major facilitator superfamily like protein n=1 Tax=Argiope bruennichi TaxID=94029 RepID=A0A8T0E6F5_ARGBR|nr:Major facilitator superfamily like protein [Argiope bruennichi]